MIPPFVPAQLPLPGHAVVRRRPADDGNGRAKLGVDPREHNLLQPRAGVQQHELRQLSRSATIGDGAAQQCPHIRLIPIWPATP